MAGDLEQRIDARLPEASRAIALAVHRLLEPECNHPICVLCIGTDRSTGDSLGPLVGTALKKDPLPGVFVVGDLEEPLHAANLADELSGLLSKYPSAVMIAVDACLGRHDHVGSVLIGRGPLRPGAGVNKSLPPVGDFFITGTVNVSGFMEYLVLQNTRLNLVMTMANAIAHGLRSALMGVLPARPSCLPLSSAPVRPSVHWRQ